MYNEAKENYVYAIAGGETQQIINYLEQTAENAKQSLKDYVSQFGIAVTEIKGHNNADISYELVSGDKNNMPKGWVIETSRAGEHLTPDYDTREGVEIADKIQFMRTLMNVQGKFDDLCHSLAPSTHLNNRRYSFEKVADDIIVTCPKQYEGDAIIPTGSTPITYLEYITLQERAQPTPPPQTRPFKNKFTP